MFIYCASKHMLLLVHMQVLPTELGGRAQFIPAEKAVAQLKGSAKAQHQNGVTAS